MSWLVILFLATVRCQSSFFDLSRETQDDYLSQWEVVIEKETYHFRQPVPIQVNMRSFLLQGFESLKLDKYLGNGKDAVVWRVADPVTGNGGVLKVYDPSTSFMAEVSFVLQICQRFRRKSDCGKTSMMSKSMSLSIRAENVF